MSAINGLFRAADNWWNDRSRNNDPRQREQSVATRVDGTRVDVATTDLLNEVSNVFREDYYRSLRDQMAFGIPNPFGSNEVSRTTPVARGVDPMQNVLTGLLYLLKQRLIINEDEYVALSQSLEGGREMHTTAELLIRVADGELR